MDGNDIYKRFCFYICIVYLTNVSYICVHFVFQVNPHLYGDGRTHLYIFTNVISLI